jgi:methyl-accepting chemotaxis protein
MFALSKLSLKTKAAVFISAILVIIISLSTAILTMTVLPPYRNAIMMTATLVGEGLVKDVKKTVDLGVGISQLEGLSEKLDELVRQYPNLGYVYIRDEAGKALYRSSSTPDSLAAGPAASTFSQADPAPKSALVAAGGSSFYDISLPVMASQGGVTGVVHLGLKSEVVQSQVNVILVRSLFIGVISFLLAATVIVLFVNRTISRPLEDLSETARLISTGSLVVPPPVTRLDEIGQLATAFQVMVGSLSSMVASSMETSGSLGRSAVDLTGVSRGLSDAFAKQMAALETVVKSVGAMDNLSRDLSEQSRKLTDSSSNSSSSTLEMTTAIAEINRNMSEITAAVENISAAILEMSTTIKQVAGSAEKTASMAEETREAIARINAGIQNMEGLSEKSKALSDNLKKNASDIGATAVKETLRGILSIEQDVKHSEAAMKVLQDRVSNIGEIVTVIDDIADQTNLLALNASIISAQAGEHGRSFAVVATEIRELSVRTTDSTKKISTLIKAVQQEADNYADYMNRVIGSVGKGLKLGQEAEKALQKITVSADESSQMAALIAQLTREQAAASAQVSRSVDVFTRGAEEIKKATSEEAKGSVLIKDAMEKAKDMIEMVYKATAEQNRGSRLIADTSEKAKEVAMELGMATDMERRLSENISRAVEALRNITYDNSQRISALNVSSQMMNELSESLKRDLGRFHVEEAAPARGTEKPGTAAS